MSRSNATTVPRRSRSAVSRARWRAPGTAAGRPATRPSSGPRTPNSTSPCSLLTPLHCTATPTGAASGHAGLVATAVVASDHRAQGRVQPAYASRTRPVRARDQADCSRRLAVGRGSGRGGPMTAHTELDAREALAERLIDDVTGALETLGVYLGLELGLYQALADLETATQAELAATAGIAPRYAREWLEQQAG